MTPVLQPPTVAKGDRHLEAAIARAADVPMTFQNVWDPATCPAGLLPWLAWGLSIDIWDPEWSEATKRQMIAEAIPRQRRKGSVKAVREVLDAFDVGLTLHEWFEHPVPLRPYTFEIRLPIAGGDTVLASFVEKVADQVVRVKPARAHFTVAQTLEAEASVGVVAFARAAISLRTDITQGEELDWSTTILTDAGEPILTEDDEPLLEE